MPLSRLFRRAQRRTAPSSPAPPPHPLESPDATVAFCYWTLLGRCPDADSRDHVSRLAHGEPADAVTRALMASPEFRFRHSDLTSTGCTPGMLRPLDAQLAALGPDEVFLDACYRLLLGRAPDPDGLAWYTGELGRGVSRSVLLWTLLNSDEFAARYRALVPAGGELPRDVQLCELANPAKWENPEWMAVLKDLRIPAAHRLAMHRKAYEFTQTIWGLQRLGALTATTRVLSVGAGHETPAYWLANHVAQVTGIDLYEGAWGTGGAFEGTLEVVAHPERFAPFEYHRERLRFLQMDGTHLAFRDGVYDVAYSLSSVEHFGGWSGARRALEEMTRVVRRGGLVVVATEWMLSGPPLDEVFSPEEVRRLLDIPGLQLVEPIDDRVWQRYYAVPVDLRKNRFETPHMVVSIDGTVFTSVIAFLRRV